MMDSTSIAPCGVNCAICLGYQRKKNTCVGCNNEGNKPPHCTKCSIKTCPEKHGNESLLCSACGKYPCRRIRDLNRRYETRYGESIAGNFESISRMGMTAFLEQETVKWTCASCGGLLCVHRGACLGCGAGNPHFPG